MTRKIFLDPGHGGTDPGAVGNGMRESDIVLDASIRLRDLLSPAFEVMLSRETDVNISNRARTANIWGADLFISVHTNAFNLQSANGAEILVPTIRTGNHDRANLSRILAQAMLNDFIKAFGIRNRGVFDETRSPHGSLGVLRDTAMPAVLIELAFITANPEQFRDIPMLRNERDTMALVIAKTIYKHFNIPMEVGEVRIRTIDEIEVWARPFVQDMIDRGVLSGRGGEAGLDITMDMVRGWMINERNVMDILRRNGFLPQSE